MMSNVVSFKNLSSFLPEASFYQGSTEFRCFSDGKSIPLEHVNDDYCDCADGSDEPGKLKLILNYLFIGLQ